MLPLWLHLIESKHMKHCKRCFQVPKEAMHAVFRLHMSTMRLLNL